MNKRKPTNVVEQLKELVVETLSSIGYDVSGVFATERGLAIPSAKMQVTLKVSKGHRVFECIEQYSVMDVSTGKETVLTMVRFEEPMEKPASMARSIALHIAQNQIDGAIDRTI